MNATILKFAGAAALLLAGTTAAQTFPTTINPQTVLTSVPNSTYPVMGVDFLSDGRMVVLTTTTSLGGGSITGAAATQAVYIVSGLSRTGSMAGATFTKVLDQLTGPPPGVVVVNDTVYVMDRAAFYRINNIVNPSSTSKANNATRIINVPSPDSSFSWNGSGTSWHQYVFTPKYHNGRFYAAYSGSITSGGPSNNKPTSSISGGVLSWAKDSIIPTNAPANTGYRLESGGLRSCNGMGASPQGIMLIADNQGSFRPMNGVWLYKVGQPLRTYGHRQGTTANGGSGNATTNFPNWAESLPYQPPVIWIPDDPGQSGSEPLYMDRGPYKGDWLLGDVQAPELGRLHLDNVDNSGNYQASYHLFTGGIAWLGSGTTKKAINRLAWSPDSAIYVGTILNLGNWPGGTAGPMSRITFKDTTTFEILSMVSRKNAAGDSNGVELTFSEAINPATAVPASFTLWQGAHSITGVYGCSYSNGASLTCGQRTPQTGSVQVSADNKRVFITIVTPDTSIGAAHIGVDGVGNNGPGRWGGPGKQDRTLRVTASGIRSATGATLFYDRVWMGWHYQSVTPFNPATVVPIAQRHPEAKYLSSAIYARTFPGTVNVQVTLTGKYTISLHTVTGALREEKTSSPGVSEYNFDTRTLGRGVHVLKVRQGSVVHSRPVTL